MNIYLATWFHQSPEGEKFNYPSVGSNSDHWDFHKIYWNCIYAFFKTADKNLISTHDFRYNFILFLNNTLPSHNKYKGFDPKIFLENLNVKVENFNPLHIPTGSEFSSFNSQFALIDILSSFEEKMSSNDVLIVCDSDCLFLNNIPEKFIYELRRVGLQFIKVNWHGESKIHGITNTKFNEMAGDLLGYKSNINYFCGGEYLGFNREMLKKFNSQVKKIYEKNFISADPLKIEELLFTVVVDNLIQDQFSDSSKFIKRVWTRENHNTSVSSDSELSILHLPAEKNRGFRLFYEKFIINNQDLNIDYSTVKNLFGLK